MLPRWGRMRYRGASLVVGFEWMLDLGVYGIQEGDDFGTVGGLHGAHKSFRGWVLKEDDGIFYSCPQQVQVIQSWERSCWEPHELVDYSCLPGLCCPYSEAPVVF